MDGSRESGVGSRDRESEPDDGGDHEIAADEHRGGATIPAHQTGRARAGPRYHRRHDGIGRALAAAFLQVPGRATP